MKSMAITVHMLYAAAAVCLVGALAVRLYEPHIAPVAKQPAAVPAKVAPLKGARRPPKRFDDGRSAPAEAVLTGAIAAEPISYRPVQDLAPLATVMPKYLQVEPYTQQQAQQAVRSHGPVYYYTYRADHRYRTRYHYRSAPAQQWRSEARFQPRQRRPLFKAAGAVARFVSRPFRRCG